MPYSSNSELPESVRSRYSDNCQSVWRHTFNSVLGDYGDEHRAFASATGQANKCQEKKSMAGIRTGTIEPTFKIFAPMLKASLDSDGKRRLHGIASSTIKDRHGDTMALSALSDMERSASNNLTIFLNHEYKVPEDVAGYVERASVRQHPQDGDIHDLVLDIVVNETNDRAIKAWDAIQNGTQLGLSIGAMIPDGGAVRDRKSGAYQIDHVELLETSLVGVPANPRSWVEYAVKSLNGVPEAHDEGFWVGEAGEELLVLKNPMPAIEGEMVGIEAPADGTMVEISNEISSDELDHTDDPPEDKKVLGNDPKDQVPGEPIEDLDTGPAQGSPEDPSVDAATGEDLSKATVNIETPFANITVDTGNRGGSKPAEPAGEASQEALLSAPETEDQDDIEDLGPWAGILPVQSALGEPDIKTALEMLEPSVVASLHNSTELLKAITRELIDTKQALEARNAEYLALEEMTKEVITNTGRILDKLSNTPVGRRAVIREANEQFASLGSVYSDDFLTILKRK